MEKCANDSDNFSISILYRRSQSIDLSLESIEKREQEEINGLSTPLGLWIEADANSPAESWAKIMEKTLWDALRVWDDGDEISGFSSSSFGHSSANDDKCHSAFTRIANQVSARCLSGQNAKVWMPRARVGFEENINLVNNAISVMSAPTTFWSPRMEPEIRRIEADSPFIDFVRSLLVCNKFF